MVGEVPLELDPDSESGVEGAVDLASMGKVFQQYYTYSNLYNPSI